ncbi:hypothetical protein SNEBB_008186 [Seison nebaliae]|nr:hypothetical protein SNEBB_008186 [Seison nebaliae]
MNVTSPHLMEYSLVRIDSIQSIRLNSNLFKHYFKTELIGEKKGIIIKFKLINRNHLSFPYSIPFLSSFQAIFYNETVLPNNRNLHDNYILKGRLISRLNDTQNHWNDESSVWIDGHLDREGKRFWGRIQWKDNEIIYIEPLNDHHHYYHENETLLIIYSSNDIDLFPTHHQIHKRSTTKNTRSFCGYEKYLKGNTSTRIVDDPINYHRRRRRSADDFLKNGMRECKIQFIADPLLYKHYYEKERKQMEMTKGTVDEDDAEDVTRTIITRYLTRLLTALNHIYSEVKFGKYSGISFSVPRIKIIDYNKICGENERPTEISEKIWNWERRFCYNNLDVSAYLNHLSTIPTDTDYCLIYSFTMRDFADGTLGLAWVGSTNNQAGGVCDKKATVHGGFQRALNTGVITFFNFNSNVPAAVSELTLAHEIGHSFGAKHDPLDDEKCVPNGADGNYIMYPKATTGKMKNNRIFSSCSLESMGNVVTDLVEMSGRKKFCFAKIHGPFCGNQIVEKGEECDCGYETDCTDQCCFSRKEIGADKSSCTLKDRSQSGLPVNCSPTQGTCCQDDCSFKKKNAVCLPASDCLEATLCEDDNPVCNTTKVQHKPLNTLCGDKIPNTNYKKKVCVDGECTGSICAFFNVYPCFMKGNLKIKNKEERERLCKVSCLDVDKKCKPISEVSTVPEEDRQHLKQLALGPGSPCLGTEGYCDVFSRCRLIDAEGPISKLQKALFGKEAIQNMKEWLEEKWYIALLGGIGVLLVMTGFVKLCELSTPSSNPKMKSPIIYDTIRRRRHRSSG